MLRTVFACSLVACVSADGHAALVKSCNDTFHGVATVTCRDIVELGRCFANNGITAFPYNDGQRILAEHELIKAQKSHPECLTEDDHDAENAPKIVATLDGDVHINVHEEKTVKVFRFKREIVDLYQVTQQLADLGQKCADAVVTDDTLTKIAADKEKLETDLTASVVQFEQGLDNSLDDLKTSIGSSITELEAAVNEKTKNMTAIIDAAKQSLTDGLDADIAAMEATVTASLSSFQPKFKFANDTGDPQWMRDYELVMEERAPSSTQNGHAGRWFFKVNFNPNTVGFFYPDRQELIRACKRLSDDMAEAPCPGSNEVDGIDRNLKPVCDHGRGDSNSVDLSGSYLSHCGCGSYPRERSCLGMSEYMLKGTVTYNHQNSWNGCQMLRHDRECHHHWVDCYSRSDVQAIFTICSSANGKEQEGPLAGCDSR